MFRYMGIRNIAACSLWLGEAGRLTGPIAEKFEQVVTKHQAALRETDAEALLNGFRTANRGSESFIRLLQQGEFREEVNALGDYEFDNYVLPPKGLM